MADNEITSSDIANVEVDVYAVAPSEAIALTVAELETARSFDFDSLAGWFEGQFGAEAEEIGEGLLSAEDLEGRELFFISWKFVKTQYDAPGRYYAIAEVIARGTKTQPQTAGTLGLGSLAARALADVTQRRMVQNRENVTGKLVPANGGVFGRLRSSEFVFAVDEQGRPMYDGDKVQKFDPAIHTRSQTARTWTLNPR